MRVHCPACQSTIPGRDIELSKGVAVCRGCGEVFSLPSPSALVSPAANAYPIAVSHGEVLRPSQLRWQEHEQEQGGIVGVLDRRSWVGAIPLLGFATVWNGFLVVWYLATWRMPVSGMAWFFRLFPLGHVAAGLLITYTALSFLFNRTTFELSNARLRVTTRPFPSSRDVTLSLAHIRRISVGPDSPLSGVRSGSSTPPMPYDLQAETFGPDGVLVSLKSPFRTEAEAAYVASRLNRALERMRTRTPYRD